LWVLILALLLASAGVSVAQQIEQLPAAQSMGPEEDEGALLMELAEVYQRHKQYEKALDLYNQALEKTTHDYDKSRIHGSSELCVKIGAGALARMADKG